MQKHMEAEVRKGKLTHTDAQGPRYIHTYRWELTKVHPCMPTQILAHTVRYKQAQRYKGTHKGIA